jgi:hypothetical protein
MNCATTLASFVALKWPAKQSPRGEPDNHATVPAAKYPLVWETLPQPQEVFLLRSGWNNYPYMGPDRITACWSHRLWSQGPM